MDIPADITSGILNLSAAIMRQLRRDGRFPTRLDEEDYLDISQEGALSALQLIHKYDTRRGSLRAFMYNAISRRQVAYAWQQATCGITGDHKGVKVFSLGEEDLDSQADNVSSILSDDVADEIEAFDHVWQTHYLANKSNI